MMRVVYLHALRKARGQILGWGMALFLLGLLLMPFYDSISSQSEQLQQLLEIYPEEFIAFFGDFSEFATPEGFLNIEFFSYMPLLLGIFAVLAGSGLLAADEESGHLDLLMGQPISRTKMFLARLLAFLSTAAGICIIAWLGLVLPLPASGMDLTPAQLALPFVSVLAIVFLFGALTALLSLLVPSRRLAATLGGVVLVASFFIEGFSRMINELEEVARYLPIHYYQGGDAMNGLKLEWVLGLAAAGLVLSVMALLRFQHKDLRVGGEGGWSLPLLGRRRKATEAGTGG